MKEHVALFAFATVLATTTTGCKYIPVKMHTETHVQHMDGTVEHKSSDWEGTLDQLPAQLGKAGRELGAVTATLAKELTEVPPPGNVTLHDVSPQMAPFEGKKGQDFLVSARDEKGKPISFQYVQLGVPQYDDFFRTAQEIHALVYQTTQVIAQMRQLTEKLLDTKIDARTELKASVDQALKVEGGDTSLVARLDAMQTMGRMLADLVPQIVGKVTHLVSAGEQLVVSAPTTLTNPKVLAHLDLVKKGLVDSVVVIKESGGLLVDLGKNLTGFGKG